MLLLSNLSAVDAPRSIGYARGEIVYYAVVRWRRDSVNLGTYQEFSTSQRAWHSVLQWQATLTTL
jgi:hypothetical protein